jgi:hypothetical protein
MKNNGCSNGYHHEKQVDARKSVGKGGGMTSGRRRSDVTAGDVNGK